jgi:hypothetical protein
VSEEAKEALATFAVGGIVFVLGVLCGASLGVKTMRTDAIAAGVAEWTVDPQTGAVEFRWKGGDANAR